MRLNPSYQGITPFDASSRARFWIVIASRVFSILLGIAVAFGAIAGGFYLTFVYEGYFFSNGYREFIWGILFFSDIPIVCLFYYANELIVHAWADRYYARIKYLEHNKINQEHEAHSPRAKATLTMIYLAGFLFPANERVAAQGDMEEQFNLAKDKFGAFRANCYLAYDICCTFLVKTAPLIKWFVKAASLTSLASFLIWLINQLELIRKLCEYIFHR